jgi:hypothetical protein
VLPTLDVSLLCAAPPNGSKRRCARDRTNSPTDEPRAGAHHHGEEILRCALTDGREPGAGQSGRPYFRSSIGPTMGQFDRSSSLGKATPSVAALGLPRTGIGASISRQTGKHVWMCRW